jgi:hypothetical protein
LAGPEANLGLIRGLVLVNVADYLLNGVQAIAGLKCGLVGLLSTIAGIGSVLIGGGSLRGSLTDAFLRASI